MAGAVLGGTADFRGSLPHDLAEVTPVLEIGHGWLSLAVESVVPIHFTVVEQISDDGGDVVRLHAGSNVLAVAASSNVAI